MEIKEKKLACDRNPSAFYRKIHYLACLAGVRKETEGKGIRARDHARGRREEGNACKEAVVFAIQPTILKQIITKITQP